MTLIQIMHPDQIILHTGKQGVYSAEVGALTLMFEKSATELKPKPKLLKCKNIVNIATFNVQT